MIKIFIIIFAMNYGWWLNDWACISLSHNTRRWSLTLAVVCGSSLTSLTRGWWPHTSPELQSRQTICKLLGGQNTSLKSIKTGCKLAWALLLLFYKDAAILKNGMLDRGWRENLFEWGHFLLSWLRVRGGVAGRHARNAVTEWLGPGRRKSNNLTIRGRAQVQGCWAVSWLHAGKSLIIVFHTHTAHWGIYLSPISLTMIIH